MRIYWRLTAFILVFLGLGASVYLLIRYFAISTGDAELFDVCQAFFGGDCDSAIRSGFGVQLGIPLSGWGVVHFVVVAVSLLLSSVLGESFRVEATLVALFFCTVAAVCGIILIVVMLSAATDFCSLCMGIHVINLLLIPIVKLGSVSTVGDLFDSVITGFKYFTGRNVQKPVLARWKVLGFATILLVGIVSYQWIFVQTDRQSIPIDPAFGEVLEELKSQPSVKIPIGADDPYIGNKNSPVQLVFFSDFQCPSCWHFAVYLEGIRKKYPRLTVVFKHYPLSNQCNDYVNFDMHPKSCEAAYASVAAERQGEFWRYHDAIFASTQTSKSETFRDLARSLGLDMVKFEADLVDPSTSAKVKSDVLLGKSLGVDGTPTLFLNEKKLTRKSKMMLERLIEYYLRLYGERSWL